MPYVFSAVLYLTAALLMAVDAAFINFEVLEYFNGIRWLRIHFITLGVLTQVLFGSLPRVVASVEVCLARQLAGTSG